MMPRVGGAPDPDEREADAPALSVVAGAQDTAATESERALVARVRTGDVDAFGQLFTAHSGTLFAYAARALGAKESAEDIVQSVFRAVWERRANWQPTASVRAYLIGATRNAVLDLLKHARTAERIEARLVAEGQVPGMSAAPASIDAAVEVAEFAAAIEAAAQELAPRCRAVFLERWRHGWSVVETARALGIAPKTVEMQWTRALAKIRERVRRFR